MLTILCFIFTFVISILIKYICMYAARCFYQPNQPRPLTNPTSHFPKILQCIITKNKSNIPSYCNYTFKYKGKLGPSAFVLGVNVELIKIN